MTRFGISGTHQPSKIFELMLRRQMLNGYVICKMSILAASLESSDKSRAREGSDDRIQSWPRSEVQENGGILLADLVYSIYGIENIQ
jgi:hypothetical protein